MMVMIFKINKINELNYKQEFEYVTNLHDQIV